jgi:thiamine pyrophosphokinase
MFAFLSGVLLQIGVTGGRLDLVVTSLTLLVLALYLKDTKSR